MKTIFYEDVSLDETYLGYPKPLIFLAGPTVRGNQPHLISWRNEAVDCFKENNFQGTLIIPEFREKGASDAGRDDIPFWEMNGMEKAHCILFWIPRTRPYIQIGIEQKTGLIGLVTNFEFGYWLAKDPNKMVYGRPDDAYRIRQNDLMWKRHFGEQCIIFNELKDVIKQSILTGIHQHRMDEMRDMTHTVKKDSISTDDLLEVIHLQNKLIDLYPEYRKGQAFFNALFELYPNLADKYQGNPEIDSFYIDSNIEKLIAVITKP